MIKAPAAIGGLTSISACVSKSRGSITASLAGSQKIGIENREVPERFSTRWHTVMRAEGGGIGKLVITGPDLEGKARGFEECPDLWQGLSCIDAHATQLAKANDNAPARIFTGVRPLPISTAWDGTADRR